jgi:hypothetical protein
MWRELLIPRRRVVEMRGQMIEPKQPQYLADSRIGKRALSCGIRDGGGGEFLNTLLDQRGDQRWVADLASSHVVVRIRSGPLNVAEVAGVASRARRGDR